MSGSLPATAASPLSGSFLDDDDAARLGDEEEVVASFDSLLQAELVRGRLEASGLPVRLKDAHTVGMASHLATAIGGVKVIVAKDDADAARAILDTPALSDEEAPGLNDLARRDRTTDDVAKWALRMALAGLAFPIIGQIASFALIAQAVVKRDELSRAGKRRVAVAIAVDVGVMIMIAASVG